MNDFTDKQLEFIKGVLEGKTLKGSYIAAYDCESMSDPAIMVEASRLRANPKIALFIDEIRQAGASTAIATLESHVAELEKLKTMALSNGNYGAAVKAEELRGKASGLYVERHEDVGERQAFANVFSEIETQNPQLAALLKASMGSKDSDDEGETKLTH